MYSNHLACRIYALGSAILFGTSFLSEMRSGVALIGFIFGSMVIAVGLGGVQASVQPFVGEMLSVMFTAQRGSHSLLFSGPIYRADYADKNYEEWPAGGRKSRTDHPVYLQCISLVRRPIILSKTEQSLLTDMNCHSRMVNVSSLGSIATTLMEKYIGFWSAYLLDLCAVIVAVVIVHLARPKFGITRRHRRFSVI